MLFIACLWFVVGCWLLVVRRLVSAVCCLLSMCFWCLLFVVGCCVMCGVV